MMLASCIASYNNNCREHRLADLRQRSAAGSQMKHLKKGVLTRYIYVTRFWKTDHIVTREINRITMFMHL